MSEVVRAVVNCISFIYKEMPRFQTQRSFTLPLKTYYFARMIGFSKQQKSFLQQIYIPAVSKNSKEDEGLNRLSTGQTDKLRVGH